MSWLGTWKSRIKLTIDQTKVDAALSDFPILVKIAVSSGLGADDLTAVFDELASDANRKKIAVTTSDEITQCYVEIERWDDASELAWLWVKVPSVAHDADTILYLYYDSAQADNTTYVGDTGSAAAQAVWDASFAGVWHLAQDPSGGAGCVLDSTANARNGTPGGTMTSGDLVDAKAGKGLDFDGGDDVVDLGIFNVSSITLEAIVKTSYSADTQMVCGKDNVTPDPDKRSWQFRLDADGTVRLIAFTDPTTLAQATSTSAGYNDGNFHHVAGKFDQSNAYAYADGSPGSAAALVGALASEQNNVFIGKSETTDPEYMVGIIDEMRISSAARSDAWIKASYNACFDTLITAGPFETYEAVSIGAEAEPAWAMQSSFTPVDLSAEAESEWTYQAYSENIQIGAEADPAWQNEGIYQRSSTPGAEASGAWASLGIFLNEGEIGVEAESEWGVYNLSQFLASYGDGIVRRYYFTLTGAEDGEDDVVIPISSFSARLRDTDPTYLGVVIPGTDYADEIAARSNGQIIIHQAWVVGGVEAYREEIARADLEEIRTDEGARNQSITLSGHRSETNVAKIATLTGASYKYMAGGKLRYRCLPDLYVRPGDTVRINNDEFTAGLITINVNALQQTMEIAEA